MAIKNKSLRQVVYKYLRKQLARGQLSPQSFIDQNRICRQLNISRAPLRDALIKLEAERFIEIIPRRGVRISKLSLKDVRDSYGVLAAVESFVVACEFHNVKPRHIQCLEALNRELYTKLEAEQFESYYRINLEFHDVYLSLSNNTLFKEIVHPLKQRLYDFPRMQYDREWELTNLEEHRRFIDSLKAGNRDAAVAVIRNEHWDFNLHEEKIRKVYGFDS